MEKISLSEILLMNPRLNLSQLKGFRYFAIDRNGKSHVFNPKPTDFIKDWDFHKNVGCSFEFVKWFSAPLDWRESLREIDFSEYEPTEDEIKHAMGCTRDPIEDISLYPLFDHLDNEHGLVLTEEQLYEIVLLAKKIKLPHEENL